MADESEVEQALVDYLFNTLYPQGEQCEATTGAFTKIYRGFPLSGRLEQDLKEGTVNVSIAARNGVERTSTRYDRDWYELRPALHTITASVSGAAVTLGGVVTTPQNIAISVGPSIVVICAAQPADTLDTIAAGLAAALGAHGVVANFTGPTLTVQTTVPLRARIGGVGTVARELKRQDKSFQISIRAPSPELRDAAARILDPALSDLNFLSLPDGTVGLVRYERTISMDTSEKMQEYRRDLFYWIEYPTIQTRPAPEVINFGINSSGGVTPAAGTPITSNY